MLTRCVHWRWHCDFGIVSDPQWGQTALIFAGAFGRTECTRLLIDAGAEKNTKDFVCAVLCFADATSIFVSPLPTTFLSWFIYSSPSTSPNLLLLMFLHFSVSSRSRLISRRTILDVFYLYFDFLLFVILSYCVQWLSCYVNRFELTLQAGRTALMRAACYGHTDCVRLLIGAGDDKDVKDRVRVSRWFTYAANLLYAFLSTPVFMHASVFFPPRLVKICFISSIQ